MAGRQQRLSFYWKCSKLLLSFQICFLFLSIGARSQRLFFSEYVRSGGVQGVEIYNPSCDSVDLSEFSIYRAPLAGTWTSVAVLSGLLASEHVYTVCGSGCSQIVGSLLPNSGLDAIGLFHNGVLIDAIGEAETWVTTPWDVAGLAAATQTGILSRRSTVTEGIGKRMFTYPYGLSNANEHSSEWTSESVDSLGSHTADITCQDNILRLTCGTRGNSNVLPSTGSAQIECPLDCLNGIASLGVGLVIGGGPDYQDQSYVCLAAIHANVMALTGDGVIPQNATDAEIKTLCDEGRISVLSRYTNTTVGNGERNRGRPHMTYYAGSSTTFNAISTLCIDSVSVVSLSNSFSFTELTNTRCLNDCYSALNHGHCDQTRAVCQCNEGYYGDSCEFSYCIPGCIHGTCDDSTGVCICQDGYHGIQCTERNCNQYNNCTGTNGVCDTSTGLCSCNYPYHGPTCELLFCPDDCSNAGVCNVTSGTCACGTGRLGHNCALIACPEDCSGIGTCDYTTGTCTCDSSAHTSSGSCRTGSCPNDCSGHGICDYFSRSCTCDYPWLDEDCSRYGG